jgi:transcriptional regulator with XRE-family HTH domain
MISRWERGEVRPSLETLRDLVRACGLELGFRLANYDDSYLAHINEQLAMTPAQRVRHMTDVAAGMLALRERMQTSAA